MSLDGYVLTYLHVANFRSGDENAREIKEEKKNRINRYWENAKCMLCYAMLLYVMLSIAKIKQKKQIRGTPAPLLRPNP